MQCFETYLLKSTLTFFLASSLSASNNSSGLKWNNEAIMLEGTTSNLINTNINTGIALHIPRGGTFDIDVKIDGFSEPTIKIK